MKIYDINDFNRFIMQSKAGFKTETNR